MKILCYGDSNTWGYNPHDLGKRFSNKERWTKIMQEILKEDEVIEAGLCGRTLVFNDPYRADCNGLKTLPLIFQMHHPIDLVVIMLGTNDLKSLYHANASTIAKGVREMIRVLRNPMLCEKYPLPKILVVSPIHLGDSILNNQKMSSEFSEEDIMKSKQLSSCIEEVCKSYNCAFLDASLYAVASKKDGVHMDEKNHLILAKCLAKKIQSLK